MTPYDSLPRPLRENKTKRTTQRPHAPDAIENYGRHLRCHDLMGLRLEETDRDRTTGAFDEIDTVLTAAGGHGSRCRTLGPILIEVYSYCKGKDCKKHTLHKVTQCEYPETLE